MHSGALIIIDTVIIEMQIHWYKFLMFLLTGLHLWFESNFTIFLAQNGLNLVDIKVEWKYKNVSMDWSNMPCTSMTSQLWWVYQCHDVVSTQIILNVRNRFVMRPPVAVYSLLDIFLVPSSFLSPSRSGEAWEGCGSHTYSP